MVVPSIRLPQRAFRHDAGGFELPQRDLQLAGERHHHQSVQLALDLALHMAGSGQPSPASPVAQFLPERMTTFVKREL